MDVEYLVGELAGSVTLNAAYVRCVAYLPSRVQACSARLLHKHYWRREHSGGCAILSPQQGCDRFGW